MASPYCSTSNVQLGKMQFVDEVPHPQGTDPETYSMNGLIFLRHLGRGTVADVRPSACYVPIEA